jgi:hypothetical protein
MTAPSKANLAMQSGADYTAELRGIRALQGQGKAVRCRRWCSAARIRRTPMVTRRGVDWRRGFVIGLPPLTSSSVEIVSSTLVTLPLGPDPKLRGEQAERGKSAGWVWGWRVDIEYGAGAVKSRCLPAGETSTITRCRARAMRAAGRKVKIWVRPRACASADGWHYTCVGGRIGFEMKRFSRVQGAA